MCCGCLPLFPLVQVRKHVKAQGEAPGGVFTVPSGVHYSKVALVDPVTKYVLRLFAQPVQPQYCVLFCSQEGNTHRYGDAGGRFARARRQEVGNRDSQA